MQAVSSFPCSQRNAEQALSKVTVHLLDRNTLRSSQNPRLCGRSVHMPHGMGG